LFPATARVGTGASPACSERSRPAQAGQTSAALGWRSDSSLRYEPENKPALAAGANDSLIDIGSGAGFPGLAIKIWVPELHVTLIESNQKKATFLREVCRTLTLTNVDVFDSRAEDFRGACADIVTMRAVERFDLILPIAASLVAPGGRLALLIGNA